MTPTPSEPASQSVDGRNELADFASLMVDEVIAKVRVQLLAGTSLSVEDQLHMLDQLIKERRLLAKATVLSLPHTAVQEAIERCAQIADAFMRGQEQALEEEGPDTECEAAREIAKFIAFRIRALANKQD